MVGYRTRAQRDAVAAGRLRQPADRYIEFANREAGAADGDGIEALRVGGWTGAVDVDIGIAPARTRTGDCRIKLPEGHSVGQRRAVADKGQTAR